MRVFWQAVSRTRSTPHSTLQQYDLRSGFPNGSVRRQQSTPTHGCHLVTSGHAQGGAPGNEWDKRRERVPLSLLGSPMLVDNWVPHFALIAL